MQAVDMDYYRGIIHLGFSLLVHHSIILYNVHADVIVNYLRFRKDLQFGGRAHDGTRARAEW